MTTSRDSQCLVSFDREIVEARLVRRYQRFFADCILPDGTAMTAHTANTGSMRGLLDAGNPVLLSKHLSTTRKLPWSLEAIGVGGTWVGCNTALPNLFVERAIAQGRIPELAGYPGLRREVKYGRAGRSRIDVLLEGHDDKPDVFVEVKNVTLREGTRAVFPDAVTERGLKHLAELTDVVQDGKRAAMVYVVQRTDCTTFAPAASIDPAYARGLAAAAAAGVWVTCLVAQVSQAGLFFAGTLPVELVSVAN